MKSCTDCIHYFVCNVYRVVNESGVKCANRCHHYLEDTRIVVLPMNLTRESLSELEDYCYERCIDDFDKERQQK